MNTTLRIAQGLLGFGFIGAGFNHGFRIEQMKSQQGGQRVAAVPSGLLGFIAACEFPGGNGVILPALTGVLAWLTPLAAAFVAYGRFVIAPL
jgi:hypothetical protein